MSGFMGGGLRGEDLGEVSVVTTAVDAEVSSKEPIHILPKHFFLSTTIFSRFFFLYMY